MSASRRLALLAPDKFKGTFTAREIAELLAGGFRARGWRTQSVPVADGGEGTADVLLAAHGGRWVPAKATDPLGREVSAGFVLLGDGEVAVVEVAAASGLWRVAADERDAVSASSRGTGELIVAAIDAGATSVIVAAGGSASTDGGIGAIAAIVAAGRTARLIVACDVRTPWEDAATVFAPQKGAAPGQVALLRARMDELASSAPKDPRALPMGGCAGGLSGGLWAWLDAELLPGGELILDAIGLDHRLAGADLVVTGEGRLDRQTLAGKAVGVVARRARVAGVPCSAVVGQNRLSETQSRAIGLEVVVQASTPRELESAPRRIIDAITETGHPRNRGPGGPV